MTTTPDPDLFPHAPAPAVRRLFDGGFSYLNPHRGGPMGHCRLRVWKLGQVGRLVMLATELDDNPGMSVTNAAAQLWEAAWQTFQPRHGAPPMAFEHYPASRSARGEHVDAVEFTLHARLTPGVAETPMLGPVRWHAFDLAAFNRLVDEHAVGEADL